MKLKEKIEIELSIAKKMYKSFQDEIKALNERPANISDKSTMLETYYELVREYDKKIKFLEDLLNYEE